ncbi:DUF1700 domain-containing protein [Thomasclavelia cocleata]|uniref:Uncharacterized membrane protein n=1 Tax=Thomasclavelia cocleata TaxID=69824 RepID=A0A1I0GZP6_9FIRM|nr:DUF1700 domain-containing protein [Thomasclavelia cocleata]MCR1961776.1 DUF1700 domain-containing protein [Thomasclavelia cocleata]NDO43478.1 DUF1700 domain-containing protein [Thomasclavelia cocleata]PJN80189.1 DUF1700 domain-containing protein [Thomasclavelia cocleata]SET76767.1 Uncharacterized membrane protein [Thomasclavelia cocleata]
MNRKEFIDKLDYLLQDIEDIEREEALQYYEDYFDEAGSENESQVIKDLGSPERVAAIIKAGLENQFDQDIEYSEKGMDNANYKEVREVIEAEVIDKEKKENHFKENPDRNRILIILIIIGIIFLALPIGGGLFGVCIGVIAALFALGIGVLTGGVICLVGAVACLVKGFMILASTPGMGLIILATGFGLIALSIGFFALARGTVKAIPLMVSGVVNLIKTIIQKVGELL